ncbi:DNA-binding protein [Kitasatospora sp. NPDC059673]|uniref:DNA-binding protein n=1 Tax=Kitasatospora sp. NPDC059673 TaxID=3346901 RepID=UPI0036A95E2A
MKTWIDGLPQIPFGYRQLPHGGEWMTREEAASCLGIGEFHLNSLMANIRRIDPVCTTDGEVAVTRASVEAEKHWRATAPRWRKVLRLLKDIAGSF